MYALIEKATNSIQKIAESGVALSPEKPVEWVLCPDTTSMSSKYDGSAFYDKPSQFHEWNGTAWVLNQAAKDAHDARVAQAAADATAAQTAKADNVIQYLVTHTPAEIVTYVNTNVTDLASAKAILGKLAVAISILAKRELR